MTVFSPNDLAAYVEERARLAGAKEMCTSRSMSRLREMWCAATFSKGYEAAFSPCQVDISEVDEQREFDFHLVVNSYRLPFQLAEVLSPGRRRGSEYARLAPEEIAKQYRGQTPLSPAEALNHIKGSIEAKANKHYAEPEQLSLLLYVNLNAHDVHWENTAAGLAAASAYFASVWLMTEHVFGCVYGGVLWPPSEGWHALMRES